MGSTFVTNSKSKKTGRGPFSTTQAPEIFLQFVPGIVKDVATGVGSKSWVSAGDTNSIIAKSHVPNKTEFKSFASDKRYYPLLRGIQDVPTKGDQVLLVNIGGIRYYLGPINTINNPNFNPEKWKWTDSVNI